MAITTFGTTFAAVVLLLPALAFAAIALVGDAPGWQAPGFRQGPGPCSGSFRRLHWPR